MLTLNFGTLSGDGTVEGNVTNSSIIAPGTTLAIWTLPAIYLTSLPASCKLN